MTSREAIEWLQQRYPQYKEGDFRNALYLAHLKGKKPKGATRLEFSAQQLEKYAKEKLEKKFSKDKIVKAAPKVKTQKSSKPVASKADGILKIPVNSKKLDLILRIFTQGELEEKIRATFEEIFQKVEAKLNELKGSL